MNKAPAPIVQGPAGRASRLEFRFGFATEQGARERNEDYVACYAGSRDQQARFGSVAVIADGVGGAKGGRVAAELAVRGFIDGHLSQNAMLGIQRNCARTVEAINRWINSLGRRDATLEGMACTLTALILRGRQAHGEERDCGYQGAKAIRRTPGGSVHEVLLTLRLTIYCIMQ